MTKREEYNLNFSRPFLPNGITKRYVGSINVTNQYASLTFINVLQQDEMQYIIDNRVLANSDEIYDPNFYIQKCTEAFSIDFEQLNFNIEGLTLNMLDLQSLLLERMNYSNS